MTKFDEVKKAKHYNLDPSGIECIEVVRHRNFNIGSAFKYLWRQGLKESANMDPLEKQIQDMDKAIYYIEDEKKRLLEAAKPKPGSVELTKQCPVCWAQRQYSTIPEDMHTCEAHNGREICKLCNKPIFNGEPMSRIGYETTHQVCKDRQRGKTSNQRIADGEI